MMLRKLLIGLILIFSSTLVHSQSMTSEEKIQEVYGSYFATLSESQITTLTNQLSRCHIIDLSDIDEGITLKNTNDLPLNTKFNNSLTHDTEFNVNTFNPLKYSLKFSKNVDQYFRIASTNYVLKVEKNI